MASVTIRCLPDELLERIKVVAAAHGLSLEQELRDTLAARYPTRDQVLEAVRAAWPRLPEAPAADIDAWIDAGRP